MPSNSATHSPDALPGNKKEGLQVICAGLGRTGTLSLTEALKVLGYKPYHYVDASHASLWSDVATVAAQSQEDSRYEDVVDKVIDRIVEQDGYTATLENPTSDIYQKLLQKYPNAKVIVTVRDSPQAFASSWKVLMDTMWVTEQTFSWRFPSFFGYLPLFRNLKRIRQFMGTTHMELAPGALTHGWREEENPDGWLGEQYERHNRHVQEHVPPKQLLVFNVKQGWKPLCDFLGEEIPESSFPHCKVNSAESLKSLRQKFVWIVYGWIPTVSAVVAGCWIMFGGRSRSGTKVLQQG